MIRSSFIAVVAALSVLVGGVASAQIGPSIRDACLDGGGPGPLCRGPQHFATLGGYECRTLGGGDACEELDGRTYNPEMAVATGDSWIGRSLAYQRHLDSNLPLQEELWAHTHNSFNADGYGDQTFYGTDPNQTYKISDQLNMGIRAVEIDLHWAPSTSGGNAVLVCHGDQGIVPGMHFGCLPTDPTFEERVPEIATWLETHPDEVVMLYLEDQLQTEDGDDPTAHEAAAATIESALGDYIYRPATNACEDAPLGTLSRADILASGKQLIVVGPDRCKNAAPSTWFSWVFARGALWKESGLDYGDDFTPERCAADRASANYATNWIRHWGDQTGLSDGAGAAGVGGGGDVTVADATNMVRCGVNMIGFDLLEPFDARLAAIVWSWATNQPATYRVGYCAVSGADARFRSEDCAVHTTVTYVGKGKHRRKKIIETYTKHRYACFDGAAWHVTSKSERFSSGDDACAAEQLGSFEVPRNGWQNEQLRAAKGDITDIWVNSAFNAATGWN